MIVRVDEGRKDEGARPGRRLRCFRNGGDHAVVMPQRDVVEYDRGQGQRTGWLP